MMSIGTQLNRIKDLWHQAEHYLQHDLLGEWSPVDIPDLTGKTAMVTGANSGVGYETARKLAENGAKVYMVCREMQEGLEAASTIRAEVGNHVNLEVLRCDMSKLENVVDLATEFQRHSHMLDILVNVAGVFYPAPLAKSTDDIELTLAIDYYAPVLLTLCLLDTLRSTPGARVVFEASAVVIFGRLDWDNLRGEKSTNSGFTPYATSKMLLTMWAGELARRVPDIDVFAVHPGLVNSGLWGKVSLVFPGAVIFKAAAAIIGSTPRNGAWSTQYAATEPSIAGKGFKFFAPSLVMLNQWPTTERPFFRTGRLANQEYAWRLWEATHMVFDEVLGKKSPPRTGLLVGGASYKNSQVQASQ